jgi:sec-independent protein translocase protein TatB
VFGVGLPEFAVIFLVAAVVFGPDKLPDYARQAARLVRMVRKTWESTQDDLRRELGPEFSDLDPRDLNPRTLVRKHILETDEPVEAPKPATPSTTQAKGNPA